MNDEADNLREALWRRKPAGTGRDELRAQPELELEARLTEALARIPAAPVPSNFTARVLAAIALEEKPAARSRWHWSWHSLLPRVAVTAAVLVFAGVGFQRFENTSRRAELARNIALVAGAQPLPSVDALENLDAIQRMSQPAHADDKLLALLQ